MGPRLPADISTSIHCSDLRRSQVCLRRASGRSRKMVASMGDRWFESPSLQRRVHKLSVPPLASRDLPLPEWLTFRPEHLSGGLHPTRSSGCGRSTGSTWRRNITKATARSADEVVNLQGPNLSDDGRCTLTLANNERVRARAVVSGARYRRLDVENLAAFEGATVHYWASPLGGRLCVGQEVALVGGGNSAGQAAEYLSGQAAKVWLIVRGRSLGTSMSRYLVERITARPNVEVLTETTVTALEGQDGVLKAIRYRSRRSGEEISRAIRHLFLFIGADPNTIWLSGSGVMLDDKGFVRTGANILRPLETSLPGVFAIGDVRSGSTKRVAAAVGDGAQVVAALHAFLAEASDKDAPTMNGGRQ